MPLRSDEYADDAGAETKENTTIILLTVYFFHHWNQCITNNLSNA
jgi:hypothetical protein